MHELEVLAIRAGGRRGVVTRHDRPRPQLRGDELQGGSGDSPDVDQKKIDRASDVAKRLPEITLAYLDERAQAGAWKFARAMAAFCGSYSVPMTTPSST
jgi:hypothetical protein